MSLLSIGDDITIYAGICLLIVGVIGNTINILVFSTVRTYRQTSCTFYFLIGSIFNLLYLIINLTTRILSNGFKYDLTRISTVWCKIRWFCIMTFPLITLASSCLATIDQYLVTSQNVRLRQLSNIKWAHRISILAIFIFCLHGIPTLLFYNISSITNTCTITNARFATYAIFYLLGLISTIPSSIMILFVYLTYRNINETKALTRQHADRQLIRMIGIEILLVLICFIPYGLNNAYYVVTSGISKDLNRLIIESFISTILTIITYFYYAISCYMFMLTSSRFCRAAKDRLLFFIRKNRVEPVQQRTTRTLQILSRTKD